MQRSILPFLVCSVFLLLFSCAPVNVVKGFEERVPVSGNYQNPYFSDGQEDYVYKTNITVYGNELTGIFIAKKISDSTHRVVFTTEFGNKLLDFEISENDFKINSVVEELNRKMLINTLKTDFRLLLKTQFQIDRQFENDSQTVYVQREGQFTNYLFVSKADGKLTQIVHASKTKEKIKIGFTSENNIFASAIAIQHHDIKLRIALQHFKENK